MPVSIPRVAMTVEQLWQPVPGGSGTYIRELTDALVTGNLASVSGIAARGHDGTSIGVDVAVHSSFLPRAALYQAWNTVRRPDLPRSCPEIDVIHATTWAIPRKSKPLVVTIHDLAFLRNPEHFTARGNRYFRRAFDVACAEADLVLVPSAVTAEDCLAHGFPAERLRIVPHGVKAATVTDLDLTEFRARNRLVGPYLLWCGTLEPRKNLATLLEAFSRILEQAPDLTLALAGPDGWGGTSAALAERLTGPMGSRVVRLGRLSENDLQRAYAGARAFCFPSLWEGFGLPVLEAMAHGVPVITSRDTSMAEFADGAGLLVDPLDADALADAILRGTHQDHDRLATAAAARALQYTWNVAATRTADAYRSVA